MEPVNQNYNQDSLSNPDFLSDRLVEDAKFRRLEEQVKQKKKNSPPVQNFNTEIEKNKKTKKKHNTKLIISNPFLFIFSKKERQKTYKENVIFFGYPLDEIPFKYRTLEICKQSAKKSPERFNMFAVPKEYLNIEFYRYCIRCKVALSKVPDNYVNDDLIKLALKSGARLFSVPTKYVTKEICEYAILQNAYNVLDIKNEDLLTMDMYKLAFDNGYHFFRGEDPRFGIPEDYITRKMCEIIIKESPRSIVYAPKRFLDANLYKLALENGLPISMVQNEYKDEIIPQYLYEEEVRKNYKNINIVPKTYLNSHIYAIACEGGLSIDDVPKDYVDEEVCISYVKKNKSIRKIPGDFRTDKLYGALIKCDADNLKYVPFNPREKRENWKRTEQMCMEYVKQKHMVNFDLFPESYFSLELRTALFKDALKYRDILDGYMNYTEYMKVKSLRPEEQILCYTDLLKRYLQERLSNPNYVIPSASEEEMQSIKKIESFDIIKDANSEIIFCKTKEEEEQNGAKLAKLIGELRGTIIKEDSRHNFAAKNSSYDRIKSVATEFYYRYKNISENTSLMPASKNILIETLWFEWKEIITDLEEEQKVIFINEMQSLNYKYTKSLEDQKIFQSIFKDISNNEFSDFDNTDKEKINSIKVSDEIDSALDRL